MRKIFFTVIALIVALSANGLAYSPPLREVSVTDLRIFIGNWYDTKGNLVLTISNDYKINGCTILAVYFDGYDYYTAKIIENNGYRNIKFGGYGNTHCESFIPGAYHRRLLVDDKIILRDSKQQRYFESVGGIYLGMDKDDVIKLYGQPSSVDGNRNIWKYREGFDVQFQAGVVNSITIYKNSDRRFDRSGLSANNSKADFERKYNSKFSSRNLMVIGHGEMIFARDNYVGLSTIDPYNAGFAYAN